MKGLKSDEPHAEIVSLPGQNRQTFDETVIALLELRNEYNIKSKYIFVRLNGEKPHRGSEIIRTMASADGVENTHLFSWTCLRKQVATVCQAMEVTENDQDLLADFLGHDIRVHRKYYRLPNSIMEKARVAKILMQVNSGNLSSKIDVNVTKDEEMSLEDGDTNESDDESDVELCMEDMDTLPPPLAQDALPPPQAQDTLPPPQAQSTHDEYAFENDELVNKKSQVAPRRGGGRRKKTCITKSLES